MLTQTKPSHKQVPLLERGAMISIKGPELALQSKRNVTTMPSMSTGEIIKQQKPLMEMSSGSHGLLSIPSPPRSLNKVVPVTAPRSTQIEAKVNKVTPDHHIPTEIKGSDRKHAPLLPKTGAAYRSPAHLRGKRVALSMDS